MDAGETLESKINRSEYKILIVDDVVSKDSLDQREVSGMYCQ